MEAAWGSVGVAAHRMNFGNNSHVGPFKLGRVGSTHTGKACADNQDIVLQWGILVHRSVKPE